MNRDEIFKHISRERDLQDAKWGDQSGNPDELWLAIIVEEIGEVAKALLENDDFTEAGAELIQVAAVAVAWLEGRTK